MKKTSVSFDKKLIDNFLERGVEKIYPTKEALRKKLLSGERLKIYQGFDPTGPYLHIGHAIGIRALRIFQQLGHEVIFLVGTYTSLVGDPDKETTRKMLTQDEIEKNMEGWKEQAAQLINFSGENPVKFEMNHRWLSQLKLKEIIELMSKTTAQRILERDLFRRRMEKGDPISFQELLYPLMQGYDSVAMKVDVEIGGADQTFNMLVGRDLVKSYLGKEKFVRTNKMMDAPDGITMSKTKGNGINLNDTPAEIYGKTMAYPDRSIIPGFELLTELPINEIEDIQRAIEKGENPMEFKKKLAFEIVKMIRGEKAAQMASKNFTAIFSERKTPDELKEVVVDNEESLWEILKKCFAATGQSNSELKRLISQGAVKVNQKSLKNPEDKLKISSQGLVLKVGKRNWFKIVTR